MVKALPFPVAVPGDLRCLEQAEGAHDVGLGEGERVFDTAVDVGLGGEVDNAVNMLVLHQFEDSVEVADIHPDKLVVGLILDILQVGEIAGVSQLVEIDDPVVRVLIDKQPDYMASDEAGPSRDYNGPFHWLGHKLIKPTIQPVSLWCRHW